MKFEYSGAGDLAAFHFIANEGRVQQYTSSGLLLGISPENTYDKIVTSVSPGDIIVIYSDGIIDSRNKNGEAFGSQRVIDVLKSKSDSDKLSQFKNEFINFTGGNYDDDISIIVIKVI